jgi:ribosome-associated translation inhibitor RaiA
MNISLHFKSFEGFDHIKAFLVDSASSSLEKFEKGKPLSVDIITGRASNRLDSCRAFECEILLRGGGLNREIFIRKSGSDFYTTVRECIRSVERSLSRELATRSRKLRRETVSDYLQEIA